MKLMQKMINKYGVEGSIILLKGSIISLLAFIIIMLVANAIMANKLFIKITELQNSVIIICDDPECSEYDVVDRRE